MPRERVKLIRQSGIRDAERFFVIASEGEVTERKYFNQLGESKFFNQEGKIELCQIKHPSGEGNPIALRAQIREIKRDVNFRPTDEFWMIIDTDKWIELLEKHGYSFDSFIEACEKEDHVKVLISNPCFEMWLILHLKQLSELSTEQCAQLLANPKIDDKPYAKHLLSQLIPGERGYSGRPSPTVFMPLIYDAIRNAKSISIPTDRYPKGLGSYVYKLVERVIKEQPNK